MNLIHINRKIVNKLKDDEQLLKEYIADMLFFADEEEELQEEHKNIVKGVYSIVTANEALIDKVGLEAYYHEDYSAKDHVSGYYHSSGKYGVMPFDWSMTNEADENWSYSFQIFKTL